MPKDTKKLQSKLHTKWDVVEDLASTVQVPTAHVYRSSAPSSASWIATSAAGALLFFGLIGGSTAEANVAIHSGIHYAGAAFSSRAKNIQSMPPRGVDRRQVSDGPDTQVGLSVRRLAALLPNYFQPAEPE